jgi:hypothetical protein
MAPIEYETSFVVENECGCIYFNTNAYLVHWSLAPEPNPIEIETIIEKLKRYRMPGVGHMLAELIQAGGNRLRYEFHELINSI